MPLTPGRTKPERTPAGTQQAEASVQSEYRKLPAVDALLRSPDMALLAAEYGAESVAQTVRALLARGVRSHPPRGAACAGSSMDGRNGRRTRWRRPHSPRCAR